jgi:hypothetical protein
VRVLGSAQADARTIEPEHLFLGPARAHPIDARAPRDHNHDGHPDRDFLFDVSESGLAVDDREVCLAGAASELPFRLCSRAHVFVPGCGRGAGLALVVPLAIVVRRRSGCWRARV